MRCRDFSLLATSGRHFRVLVFVFGIAGRAPGLFDVFCDHRDHRMIGNAALARTVVVQNVTEPKPALFHRNSPLRIRQAGCKKLEISAGTP
jgi:hypothetical protein